MRFHMWAIDFRHTVVHLVISLPLCHLEQQ